MEHHALLSADLSTRDCYRLLTDVITPRPIAWISTLSASGRGNLAPFSYFQAVGSSPPTIVVGIGWRRDGTPKDTLANILETREFTVSHVSDQLGAAMNVTAADLEPGRSEWDTANAGARLASAPAQHVDPPRVANARAALECRLVHALPIGQNRHGTPASTMVVAEVVCFTVDPSLLQRDEAGHLRPMSPRDLSSVGRLGGLAYTRTDDPYEMDRP